LKTSDKNASSSEKKEDGGDPTNVKANTTKVKIGIKDTTHNEHTVQTSETHNNRQTLVNESDVTEPIGVSTNPTGVIMTTVIIKNALYTN